MTTNHSAAGLQVRELHHKFGKTRALDGVSFDLEPGNILSILGPNGAGKTTLIRLMLGLLPVQQGTIHLQGQVPGSRAARCITGAMLQETRLPDTLTVADQLRLFSAAHPAPLDFDTLIRSAALEGLENRRYSALSGGQKRRLQFALAICGRPRLLFLDEPTTGLDAAMRQDFWRQIRNLSETGTSIILTTHYLEEADALADRIMLLQEGRVVARGTPAELKATTRGRLIRCRTRLSAQELKALPGVELVQGRGARMEIISSDCENLLRSLLARDSSLADLSITEIGLEQVLTHCHPSAPNPTDTEEAA